MKRGILVSVILGATILACCKKVTVDCIYRITPVMQDEKDDPLYRATDVVAYAFYADTAQWAVKSYEDALNGVLTSRTGAATMNYALKTEQDDEDFLPLGPVVSTPLMVVVCDRKEGIYAWRQAPMEADIPRIEVDILFRPWQADTTYSELNWIMVNPPKM